MKNQVKLPAANLILAAAAFAIVGAAHADAQTPANASSVKATVVKYMSTNWSTEQRSIQPDQRYLSASLSNSQA